MNNQCLHWKKQGLCLPSHFFHQRRYNPFLGSWECYIEFLYHLWWEGDGVYMTKYSHWNVGEGDICCFQACQLPFLFPPMLWWPCMKMLKLIYGWSTLIVPFDLICTGFQWLPVLHKLNQVTLMYTDNFGVVRCESLMGINFGYEDAS